MKQSALEEYTKQNKLYGQNDQEILAKFIQYSEQCSDPMNIYKYMEEKSICIYLANYWCSRSNLFAEMGDFRDALLCLKEATSRNHIVNENEVSIDEHLERIKRKLLTTMKRHPPKLKRTASEYDLMYDNEEKVTMENLESLIEIFENNYKTGKKEIEKEFELKIYGKNKSWLSHIEQQKEENFRKIEEKINSQRNTEGFLSMRTPNSKKDTMRLTKIMDSIEMLKKKRSTQPKETRKNKITENQNIPHNSKGHHEYESWDNNSDQNDDDEAICVNTTPVGRDLTLLSRRVTFNTTNPRYRQIEKIRGDSQNDEKDEMGIGHSADEEEEVREKSKNMNRRGSILKNKHGFLNMDEDI